MSEDETRMLDDARPFEERVIEMIIELRQEMTKRFDSLDERVQLLERKSYDTKPMWERALAESIETRRVVEENSSAIEELRRIVEKNFRDFNHKNDVFHQDLLDLKWRVRDIEAAHKTEDTRST